MAKPRVLIIAAVIAVAVAIVAVVTLNSKSHEGKKAVPVAVIVDAAPPPPPPPDVAPAKPTSKFVGSAKCAECHEKEHAVWQTSWHAKALSPGTKKFIVGNYNNQHFKGNSSEAWMKRDGAGYLMRAFDAQGAPADFKVDWVIGGKRMQDSIAIMPDGRWQVLPVYYHVTGKSWVDYTESKQGALTPDHPFYWTNVRRMANHECLDCHTTGLRVDYDARPRAGPRPSSIPTSRARTATAPAAFTPNPPSPRTSSIRSSRARSACPRARAVTARASRCSRSSIPITSSSSASRTTNSTNQSRSR